MILKALYDYYNRCDNLPALGMEEKEIGFIIVISKEGKFLRFEDCRTDKNQAKTYLVKKHVGRSRAVVANYLYDNSTYVLGYADMDVDIEKREKEIDNLKENVRLSDDAQKAYLNAEEELKEHKNKRNDKEQECLNAFKEKIADIYKYYPNSEEMKAISNFYLQDKDEIRMTIAQDSLWKDIKKNLSKKYSTFSFRIDGDIKIVAEKRNLLQLEETKGSNVEKNICLITGNECNIIDTTTATMIPGSQATAKLVAFQVNSGYDSYGKKKCGNAPISKEAEFAYTTALNTMLQNGSHNKFSVGNRIFLFWASSNDEASEQAEKGLFNLFGYSEEGQDDPNSKIEQVRKVFTSIYLGRIKTTLDDRFYILGLAPNSARIAVVYWSETSLKDFAGMILRHFDDMEIVDTREDKKPYRGIKEMLSAVTFGGKQSDATPNLPESVIKSIFQGIPYPYTLFSSCIRRIRAESGGSGANRIARIAIIKAYLKRKNNKIEVMLDKSNTNQGYLCGRLFAVLDRIQEDANGISSIRERYMNAASATPSSVFATILNLSSHHSENLSNEAKRIFYEKLKQEIINKISADGFPAHLGLQDQGRFFVGYYHQRQDFFTRKEENKN